MQKNTFLEETIFGRIEHIKGRRYVDEGNQFKSLIREQRKVILKLMKDLNEAKKHRDIYQNLFEDLLSTINKDDRGINVV